MLARYSHAYRSYFHVKKKINLGDTVVESARWNLSLASAIIGMAPCDPSVKPETLHTISRAPIVVVPDMTFQSHKMVGFRMTNVIWYRKLYPLQHTGLDELSYSN